MKTKILLCGIWLLGAFSASAQDEWFEIPSGTDKKLNTISFPSSMVGYIGGNDSLLLKTSDGGRTWSEMNYSGVTFYPGGEHILNLQFVSETVGFMTVGPYSGNYKTTDGGMTWETLSPQTIILCYNQGMYFFDENNGFVGGSGCFTGETIGRLSNGDWTESNLDETMVADNYITDIDFLNTSFGLAVSRSGYIYRTTDGGTNWDSIPSTPWAMSPLTGVLIVNDTVAYASYDATDLGFGLYITTDAGLSWEQDMNSATFYYPDFYTLHQSGDGTIYTAGEPSNFDEGLIFESPGDLMTWNYHSVGQPVYDISSYDDTIVFAVGDSGYVVVNHEFENLGLDEKYFTAEATFSVYPNPVKDILQFDLAVSPAKDAELRIYDLNGKLLHTGKYEAALDVSELRSGLYLLELESAGNVQRTRFIRQ
ncbi:MAG: T9SS type A sorting domain-containing protein [Bacteroidota bacterium]